MSRALCAAAALLAVGCRAYVAPSPALLETIARIPPPESPYVQQRLLVAIESPWVSGQFDGVLVARTGRAPAVRLQVFPDLGGRVIDIVATSQRIAGRLPQTRQGSDRTMPLAGRPNAVDVLGVILLEHFAQLTVDATLGMKEEPDGWWVLVRPVVDGFDEETRLGRDGTVRARRTSWGWAATWEEAIDGRDSRVAGRGMSLRLTVLASTPLDQAPDGAFDLAIPSDVRALE